jgi:hypothetical protein
VVCLFHLPTLTLAVGRPILPVERLQRTVATVSTPQNLDHAAEVSILILACSLMLLQEFLSISVLQDAAQVGRAIQRPSTFLLRLLRSLQRVLQWSQI